MVKYPESEIEEFIRNYVVKAGANGAVIGLSGGLDSTVAAYLTVRALGSENLLGLILPEKEITRAEDIEDAENVCNILNIKYEKIDISSILKCYSKVLQIEKAPKIVVGNLKARVRMILLYWHANLRNLLVIGTGNKTEILLGYSTKYGDAAADIMPLAGLFKKEIWDMAERLEVPLRIIEKKPSAGLWPGQTDEEELGITYRDADQILQEIENRACLEDLFELHGSTKMKLILKKIKSGQHKRELPPTPQFL